MKRYCFGFFVLFFLAVPVSGPAEEGQKTRLGAVTAGNATEDIPAFEGVTSLKCPVDYEKGDFLPNPYKDETSLFRIDHTNVDQFKDRLSPGQVARLKKNTFFFMNIYPTHRNFEHPEKYYQATEKNV